MLPEATVFVMIKGRLYALYAPEVSSIQVQQDSNNIWTLIKFKSRRHVSSRVPMGCHMYQGEKI
jgi:hypothetical protein